MHIETQRLIITEFTESMAQSFSACSLDEDNRRFLPDEVDETPEMARVRLARLIGCYEKADGPLVYPILLKNGTHIGHVEACPIKEGWEIGYHVHAAYTGNGYATEAVRAFVPVIMRWLGIKKMFGICRAENVASHRVLEKCGFRLIVHRSDKHTLRYDKEIP